MSRRLFTSESVTEGHPDKIADQISDSILDALLTEDPKSRVAVETLIMTGQVHVAGEVTTTGYADIPQLVRDRILEIGYDSSAKGFDGHSCGVSISIGSQSKDANTSMPSPGPSFLPPITRATWTRRPFSSRSPAGGATASLPRWRKSSFAPTSIRRP